MVLILELATQTTTVDRCSVVEERSEGKKQNLVTTKVGCDTEIMGDS